jgi:hypothetical protein
LPEVAHNEDAVWRAVHQLELPKRIVVTGPPTIPVEYREWFVDVSCDCIVLSCTHDGVALIRRESRSACLACRIQVLARSKMNQNQGE